MGILQKKRCTTGKKALAYRAKGGQNTDTAFPALRLMVVLDLVACLSTWQIEPKRCSRCRQSRSKRMGKNRQGHIYIYREREAATETETEKEKEREREIYIYTYIYYPHKCSRELLLNHVMHCMARYTILRSVCFM